MKFKSNWLAGTSVVISVVALCLCALRIEPIEVGSGTVVGVGVGLIGVCAAVMVAAQVYGLHYSEEKMRKELDARADKILNEANYNMKKSLFRNEMVTIVGANRQGDWAIFTEGVNLATGYIADLKDGENALFLNDYLLESNNLFPFYKQMNESDRRKFDNCIIRISKLVDNPRPLLDAFNPETNTDKYTS
ncbi:hypothetical protein Barb6_02219 [Bacteroidales bacterium Barb6]|nr:hypothetical protein Barb6_02216 [Bacteroidales bacterium Barb6]OAV67916.1 hypothetical protein Barb6_02219 [Bacteroidales bacterium Barb6]